MSKSSFFVLRYLGLGTAALMLSGCTIPFGFGDSGGPVGKEQWGLLVFVVAVMMIVLAVVYAIGIWCLIKYRRVPGNTAKYEPNWDTSKLLGAAVWLGPIAIIITFAIQVWEKTHALDPYLPLAATEGGGDPIQIQAIALDWKWLMIYPKEGIGSVNEMTIPVGAPVTMHLTADTVMNAMIIQGLAGQIMTMAGMETQLNLRADVARDYIGRNMQFSGAGFPRQFFKVRAVSRADYESWVAQVKAENKPLDTTVYMELRKPNSPNSPHQVIHYSAVPADLFQQIIAGYAPVLKPATEADSKLRPPGSPEPGQSMH